MPVLSCFSSCVQIIENSTGPMLHLVKFEAEAGCSCNTPTVFYLCSIVTCLG